MRPPAGGDKPRPYARVVSRLPLHVAKGVGEGPIPNPAERETAKGEKIRTYQEEGADAEGGRDELP